jgi:nickel transport protein
MSRRRGSSVLAVLALLVLWPAPAAAHRVNVYAYVADGMILGEGYFSNGNRAMDSQVEVRDADGKPVGQARTDDQGRFSLPLSDLQAGARPPLEVVLRAGEGHQATFALKAAGPASPAGEGGEPAAAPAAVQAATAPVGLSGPEVERIVGTAVAQGLAPLSAQVAQLAERQDKVAFRDIIGGLGWIAGLFGVAAYLAGRRAGR